RKQRDELIGIVRGCGGFEGVAKDERCEFVESGLKRAVWTLSGLAKVWKPIMPTQTYLRTIGILVDTTLTDVLKEVAKLTAVKGDEAHQLRYLLGVLGKVEGCFEKVSGVGKKKVVEKAPVYLYVKSWEAYVKGMECLEKRPADFLKEVNNSLQELEKKE
ncbi:Centromere/kinetochore protein zw10, partial [Rhizophlyctis rosea]